MENKSYQYDLTTSVSTPIEYYKVLILQRVNDLIEAWEHYYKNKVDGSEISTNIIHARTCSLYLALQPYLRRKSKDFEGMFNILFDKEPTEKDLFNMFNIMNTQLDTDRLTRMDTKQVYDGTRIEIENEAKGL